MTARIVALAFLFGLGMFRTVDAQTVPLVADLSNHLVAITTGFTGTDVLLFGATDGPGDVVIVVRGPSKDVTIRRKDRVGPIWVNSDALAFRDVPSFYHVASNRDIAEFTSKRVRALYEIGVENLKLKFVDPRQPDGVQKEYADALIRLNADRGLYNLENGKISLLANRLFRAQLHFPSNVPTGPYEVGIYLFRNGDVVSGEFVPLIISKTGIGAEVYDFAHNFAPLYGILAIIIAVLAGWAAEAAFRRR
ncbi:MAG: TIGR02186 family protein [Rhodospirillaceae bacterium]|nr:TIGR02186 family protein [Rhodospirillaceae bacterium]